MIPSYSSLSCSRAKYKPPGRESSAGSTAGQGRYSGPAGRGSDGGDVGGKEIGFDRVLAEEGQGVKGLTPAHPAAPEGLEGGVQHRERDEGDQEWGEQRNPWGPAEPPCHLPGGDDEEHQTDTGHPSCDAAVEGAEPRQNPEQQGNEPGQERQSETIIRHGEAVLFRELDDTPGGVAPVAFDVRAAQPDTRSPSCPPEEQAQLDVIDDCQAQGFVSADGLIGIPGQQIEGADPDVATTPVEVNPCQSGGDQGGKGGVPGHPAEMVRGDAGGERHVVGLLALGGLEGSMHDVRLKPAIGIGKQEPIPACLPGSQMAGVAFAEPEVGEGVDPHQANPLILGADALKDGGRSIRGTIIHHHQFQGDAGLLEQMLDRVFDAFLLIPGGEDDGDLRLWGRRPIDGGRELRQTLHMSQGAQRGSVHQEPERGVCPENHVPASHRRNLAEKTGDGNPLNSLFPPAEAFCLALPASMRIASVILLLSLCFNAVSGIGAEGAKDIQFKTLSEPALMTYNPDTGDTEVDGGVEVRYEDAVMTAKKLKMNKVTGEVHAEGNVRVERGGQVWLGEQLDYNFKSRALSGKLFRTGQSPLFASGESLSTDINTSTYSATNAIVTGDDYASPGYYVRARKIIIVPGEYVRAEGATIKVGNLPVFYLPVWTRSLKAHRHYWVEVPGFRSRFGPYLLSSYNYRINDHLLATVDIDAYQKRGFGYGPELSYDYPKFGKGEARYYHIQDDKPGFDPSLRPIPDERQRAWFEHQTLIATNFTLKGAVKYQSDAEVIRDFFESEYRRNVQPATYAELAKQWDNWSLNVLAQPRVNDFFETVERLPDVKLTGLRQQIGSTPFFYESDTSAGYLRRQFAENATNAFAAGRADTFHQVVLPHTFFNWLNVTPRVGGRMTYYSEVDGLNSVLNERERYVFNTGAEVSTKMSRVWNGAENRFFEINGLRHIFEPSLNYVFVPSPSRAPRELPQFDYEIPSRRLLPIDYPDYNAIDSIDSQNVIRMGLRNKLQTKRQGQVEDFASWALYSDWRLNPHPGQGSYSDLYSDLDLAPFHWLNLSSELRYSLDNGDWKEANHYATLIPNNVWSFSVGHRYFRDDPIFGADSGHNLISTRFYYRLSENWGLRSTQHFEARDGVMEEQVYSIYRDWRSWTSVLSFRVRQARNGQPEDYTVAVVFNFKAHPRYKLGQDVNEHADFLTR